MENLNLTLNEKKLLIDIENSDFDSNSIYSQEIYNWTNIARSSISGIVSSLCKKGLLEKNVEDNGPGEPTEDYIETTDAGEKAIAEIIKESN